MADFSKQFLSGSSNGRMIKVAATATPGTLIHTAHATSKDEIWLWAVNTSSSQVILTVEWGGTTSPDDTTVVGVTGQGGLYLLVPGGILSNSLVVRAFAATANVIDVMGFVNRIG